MKKFGSLLLFLISLTGSAQFLDAPAVDHWQLVDEKVYQENLCTAYVDAQTYTFSNKNCTWLGCDEYNYYVKTFCKQNADGTRVARLEHWDTSGHMFSSENILESDWLAKKGNLLRYRAAFVESFGNLFILQSARRNEEGQLRADYVVQSQGGKLLEEGYWVFGDGPSIPQVLERHAKKYSILTEETTQLFIE